MKPEGYNFYDIKSREQKEFIRGIEYAIDKLKLYMEDPEIYEPLIILDGRMRLKVDDDYLREHLTTLLECDKDDLIITFLDNQEEDENEKKQ